jgi:hypothetical protein
MCKTFPESRAVTVTDVAKALLQKGTTKTNKKRGIICFLSLSLCFLKHCSIGNEKQLSTAGGSQGIYQQLGQTLFIGGGKSLICESGTVRGWEIQLYHLHCCD